MLIPTSLLGSLLLIGAQAAGSAPPPPLPAPDAGGSSATVQPVRNRPQTEPSDEGDIVVVARSPDRSDPLETVNAKTFAATQAVDDAFVAPASRAYQHAVPSPVRSGLRNFLANLHEPVVFANYLLQLKPGKAAETAGRFALNTTIGVAGLFDMAKRRPFGLPQRPNGFANTLGYYGVGPGAYLFLPLVGPTTVRDLLASAVDRAIQPLSYIRPFNRIGYALPSSAVRTLDRRVELDAQFRDVRASSDPYVTRRDAYLDHRRSEIASLHGSR